MTNNNSQNQSSENNNQITTSNPFVEETSPLTEEQKKHIPTAKTRTSTPKPPGIGKEFSS